LPYSTSTPGIGEARYDAIKARMVAKLSDLQTAIAGISPAITLGVSLTSACVHIGDPEKLPAQATNPFWFAIVGGGKQDGRDQSIDLKASGAIFDRQIYTNIYWYLHPDTLPESDEFDQAEARERLRERVSDWILGDCFNLAAGMDLTLTSREYIPAPNYDTLREGYVHEITKGYVQKSFGSGMWVFHAHYMHQARIYGGY
jgi:hypothetical protein